MIDFEKFEKEFTRYAFEKLDEFDLIPLTLASQMTGITKTEIAANCPIVEVAKGQKRVSRVDLTALVGSKTTQPETPKHAIKAAFAK